MKALRRLALTALAIAFVQIVFGAIVRITNSGMGCGDHWPKCLGQWVPPMDRPDLVIEVTHRYLALLVGIPILALVIVAWTRRGRQAGVAGPGGVLRAALLALGLYVVIAQVGRVIVQFGLHSLVIAAHLVLAMSLLATLVAAVMRAGGLGALAAPRQKIAPATRRATVAAAGLTFVVVAMGALTANWPGAAGACLGFPACTQAYVPTNGAAHIQITHRVLALLLLLHLVGVTMMMRKRGEVGVVTTAARVALGAVIAQIVVAAILVTTNLPKGLQSLHQAVGTFVWLAVFALAALAARAATREGVPADAPDARAGARSDDPKGERVKVPPRAASRTPVRAQEQIPATAAQATVAFVCTTGPNARMVRVDPNDDAGFAAAEAGGPEEIPPADEPMPDVPALAETGSWSLADLSIGLPPHADEHLPDALAPDGGDEPRRPEGERRDGRDGKDGRGGPGDDGHGPVSAFAAPFVAAALMASSGDAIAQSVEAHESAALHEVATVVTPASVPAFAPYTSEVLAPPVQAPSSVKAPQEDLTTERTEREHGAHGESAIEVLGDLRAPSSVGSVVPAEPTDEKSQAPAPARRRPHSLAVIIARGAMS